MEPTNLIQAAQLRQAAQDAPPVLSSALPFIGCAGWSLPKAYVESFPSVGSHLERYAARFNAVEINSSFYRPHRQQTYSKWACAVSASFRFAVKMPKSITHEHRLQDVDELLNAFLEEVAGLGNKLGPLLVQLPPSLVFNSAIAGGFFSNLRERFSGQAVCEPRHPSWFGAEANKLLVQFEMARVAADPPPVPQANLPGGWDSLVYYRLHGSPVIYYSTYPAEFLNSLLIKMQENSARSVPTWCIFDNTAEGAATRNALQLTEQAHS